MKEFSKIIALTGGFVAMVVVLSLWSRQKVLAQNTATVTAGSTFTLYCSRFSAQDTCTELYQVGANGDRGQPIDNFFAAGTNLVITDFEWTAINCTADPNEEFRAVLTTPAGTAFIMQSGTRADDNGLAVGANHATSGVQLKALAESMIYVPCGSQTATLRGYYVPVTN